MEEIRVPVRLKRELLIAQVKSAISDKVKEIPRVSDYKHSEELCELVGVVAKTLLPPRKLKKYGISVEEVVYEVMTSLFQYSEQEQRDLKCRVEYLNNKGLIKVSPFLKSTAKVVGKWILKKLL